MMARRAFQVSLPRGDVNWAHSRRKARRASARFNSRLVWAGSLMTCASVSVPVGFKGRRTV